MFLTHADDVADHAAFARAFGCKRVMHQDDVRAGTREVEQQIAGADPVRLLDVRFEWLLPGHGRRWRAPSAQAMRVELEHLVRRMRAAA